MTCVGCGFEIIADFAFCPRCGRRQPMSCASCGFACEPDFAFCPRCGAPQRPDAAAKPQGRTRPIAGKSPSCSPTSAASPRSPSASIPRRCAPSRARCSSRSAQAITRYGGFVAKYLGDAVLALFGAPVAHEDDPERALDAALDMLQRAAALSGQWAARLGQPVTPAHRRPYRAGRRRQPGQTAPAPPTT